MKLFNEPGLARDLETGLGEFHWLAAAYEPSLRLRLTVCGLSTLALVEAMRMDGMDAEAIISTPNIPADPGAHHVFARLTVDNEAYLIDPTYSQFLDMTGLSPGYVVFGGEDLFPAQKIEIFKAEDRHRIAAILAQTAVNFRMARVPIPELQDSTYRMNEHTYDEMVEEFSEIWNPEHFDTFESNEDETKVIVPKFARMISPAHTRLVA